MNEMKKLGSAAAANTGLLLFMAAAPAMGASADVSSAFVMGIAVFVLAVLTAVVVSALRKVLSGNAVIAAAVIVAAGFASMLVMLIRAYLPAVYPTVWMYLAVCAVNFMLISQSEQGLGKAVRASLIFFAAVLLTAVIREVLGAGSFAGVALPFMEGYKLNILTQAPGGFIVFALVMAAFGGNAAKKGE